MTRRLTRATTGATLLLVFLLATTAAAQRLRAAPGSGTVSLPHSIPDGAGGNWVIHRYGWLQQQGNQPVYSQGAILQVNGNQVNANQQQARLDAKTGEIVLENVNVQPLALHRRIKVEREQNYVRIIDVFRNPTPQEQVVQLQWQTNLNFGVQNAQLVEDARKRGQQLAWVAQTHANKTAVEVFAGRNAKLAPDIKWQQGNNIVQAELQLTLAAGKEAAVMHLHALANTPEQGTQFVTQLKETVLLADVAPEVRRVIVNFNAGTGWIGDHELLRGDVLDVVELRGGDQVKGTLRTDSWQLETFYGQVELPADRVLGLLNIGQFRPRQLLVTTDGEIFGGKLRQQAVALEMSSGQLTQVPLGQIARIGYRKRPGEPEEFVFEKPLVMLRSGDRVAVQMPAGTLDVATRYGLLKLRPQAVAAVTFQSEEHGVHEIQLTDGSRFAGVLVADKFDMKLASTAGDSSVSFPAAAMSRLQFVAKPVEPAADTPTLRLANEDLLVGLLTGQLKLDTTFDTLTINGNEVRALSRLHDSGLDVQVVLWDQTTVSGQLQSPQVTVALASGIELPIPVALVERYANPQPVPSGAMVERIRQIARDLAAEDWKQRESAEQQLVAMGPIVVPVLRELAPSQPPEAQQRIDSILKQFEKTPKP